MKKQKIWVSKATTELKWYWPSIMTLNWPVSHNIYQMGNTTSIKFHPWKLIRPSMLLWERGQIAIVNFLDHSELQIPQKTFVSVWQGNKLRRILKQLVYCYVIAQHGSHAFHVKVCPMTCTCLSYECRHSIRRSNWANSSVSASIRHWNRNRESLITKNEK